MKITRLFSREHYKGTRDYLRVQGRYELARTVLYFAISASLFFAGILSTGSRMNLLTIVAVLGCLPACQSAIDTFMFLRYKGCTAENASKIEAHLGDLQGLYDRIFTSYEKNYEVAHITVCGNTICGYSHKRDFPEQDFYKHLQGLLRKDGFKDVTIKIFTDIDKYTERLEQMHSLKADAEYTLGIIATLNSVSL